MRRILAGVIAGIMLCPMPSLAAGTVPSVASQVREALTAADVGSGTEVSVTLRNKTVVSGRLDYVGASSIFVIESDGSVTQIPYSSLAQLRAGSPGYGTKIVLAVAVVAAVALVIFLRQWAGAN